MEIEETRISSETVKELDEAKEVENLKKIEAALFISGKFLNLQELVMLTDVNPLMLKELIERLIEKYNNDDSAIEIIIKENMWKMDVRQEYVDMINKLATGNAEFSKAEQETLAVIAYKQPVKQSVIIKIRGNKAYDHIKKFIEIGLVIGKRMGHTKELRLSNDFFEYFHLQKKEEGGKIVAIEEGDVSEEEIEVKEETNEESKEIVQNLSNEQESKEVVKEGGDSGEETSITYQGSSVGGVASGVGEEEESGEGEIGDSEGEKEEKEEEKDGENEEEGSSEENKSQEYTIGDDGVPDESNKVIDLRG